MITVNLRVLVSNAHNKTVDEIVSVEIGSDAPLLPPVIDSVDVSPLFGPPGTLFTFTINAHDQNVPPSRITGYGLRKENDNGTEEILQQTSIPNVFTWQSPNVFTS